MNCELLSSVKNSHRIKLLSWVRFLLRLSAYSEKRAPNSATEATMVAASRYGDGADDIDIDDEISNRSAVASSIRRRSRGMVLFVLVTDSFFRAVLFKSVFVNIS